MSSIINEINKLKDIIDKANIDYYLNDEPTMSDSQYDLYYQELLQLEEDNPSLVTSDSPTQSVGQTPVSSLTKVTHAVPMLSLDNAFNSSDIEDFVERVHHIVPGSMFYMDEKMDGVACELTYKYGELVQAVTRGDGKVGESVLHNVLAMKTSVQKTILDLQDIETVSIRGEIVMPRASLRLYNLNALETGAKTYVNTRNAAAGSLRRLDPEKSRKATLMFFAYGISSALGGLTCHEQIMIKLKSLGFLIPSSALAEDSFEILDKIKDFEKLRTNALYDTDGVVIKVDSINSQLAMGTGTTGPKWAVSYKFPAEEVVTTLENIVYQVGRTGMITPVANITPVFVSGVEVSNATLANAALMLEKGVRVGAKCFVRRAGEVIPEIVSFIRDEVYNSLPETHFIKHCPSCNSELVTVESGRGTMCVEHDTCDDQVIATLQHLAGRDVLYIVGLGRSIATKLVKSGLARSLPDLGSLTVERLVNGDICSEVIARKLVNNIQTVLSELPLYKAIMALCIKGIGRSSSVDVANVYGTLDAFINQEGMLLEDIPGIGDETVDAFNKAMVSAKTQAILNFYKTINITSPVLQTHKPLKGLNFMFTGSFESFKRKDEVALVKLLGGKLVSTIKEDTLLVTGSNPGPKVQRALKAGAVMLTEDQYHKLKAI